MDDHRGRGVSRATLDPARSGPSRDRRSGRAWPRTGARQKVLLVDDSQTFLFVARSILQRAPLDVITARDGAEGLAKAAAEEPDLIVMDVLMPVMDGLEATRRLRLDPAFRDVPILLVTSEDDALHRYAAAASGGTELVVKPVEGAAFLAKVMGYLSR